MEQVGGWGEVMNATVLTKGGSYCRDPSASRRACAGQVAARRKTPGLFARDDRNKGIITRLSGEALREHGGESGWNGGAARRKPG